jgi:hypothetical protein
MMRPRATKPMQGLLVVVVVMDAAKSRKGGASEVMVGGASEVMVGGAAVSSSRAYAGWWVHGTQQRLGWRHVSSHSPPCWRAVESCHLSALVVTSWGRVPVRIVLFLVIK